MRGGSIQLNHFLLYQRELFSWIMKLVEGVYFADTRNLNGRKFWQFPVKKLGLVPRFAEILRKWLLARVAIKRMGRCDKGLTKYLTNKAIMVTDICYIEDFSLYSMTGKHFIVLQTVIRECLKEPGYEVQLSQEQSSSSLANICYALLHWLTSLGSSAALVVLQLWVFVWAR